MVDSKKRILEDGIFDEGDLILGFNYKWDDADTFTKTEINKFNGPSILEHPNNAAGIHALFSNRILTSKL